MTVVIERAKDVFAPFDSGGNARGIDMGQAQRWGILQERMAVYGAVSAATKTALDAITPAAGTYPGGVVFGGSEVGFYAWNGSDWGTKIRGLPDTAATLTNVGGSANAITADTETGVDPAEVKLRLLVPNSTNTGATTLAENGEAAAEILSRSGNSLIGGELVAGELAIIGEVGGELRLANSARVLPFQGAYAGATPYATGDLVESGGSIWYSLQDANTGNTPSEGAYWTLFLPGVTVADGAVTLAKLDPDLGATRIFSQSAFASLTLARAAAETANGIVLETGNGRLSMAHNLILMTTTETTHDGVFIISSTGSETQADGAVLVGYGADHATWPGHLFFSALTTGDAGRIFSDSWHKFRKGAVFNGRWAQTLGTYDYLDCPDPDGIVTIFGNSGTLGTVSPELVGFTAATDANILVIESNANADVGITIAAPNNRIVNLKFGDPENAGAGRIAYNHSNDQMFFAANATALFYLDGGGFTSIGTSPVSPFRLLVQGAGTTSSTYAFYVRDSASSSLLQIRDDGLIYAPPFYNQTSATSANLNAASNGLITRATSALKYKRNLRAVTVEAVETFMSMDGFRYQSSIKTDDQTKWHYGFAADHAHELGLTELVAYNDNSDGKLEVEGFAYDRAVVLHHAKIKSLSGIVDAHDSSIVALVDTAKDHEKRITKLEERVAA